MRGSSLKSLIVVAALSSLTAGGNAAVLVGPTGTGVQAFPALPAVTDWSTVRVPATGGGAGTYVDAATMDAAIIANTVAANVNVVLNTSGTVPPSQDALARWNSTGLFVQTRPTGSDYAILMVTLQNDSGGTISQLTVNYEWNQGNPNPVNEEIPGHRAFYSMDGLAGSWVLIPEFSTFTTSSTAQSLSATLNTGSWAHGGVMYIIWCDDNGSGSTTNPQEGGYSIDNFVATPGGPQPPQIITDPQNATLAERGTLTLTVVQSGGSSFKWFRGATELANGTSCVDGHDRTISGATSSTLTIAGVAPGDAGAYHVEVSNTAGNATSGNATVTVTPDTTAPTVLYALCGSTPYEVIIVFSEQLNDGCQVIGNGPVTDIGSWSVEDIGGAGLGVVNFTNTAPLQNGQATLGLVLDPNGPGHDSTKSLRVTWTADFTDAAAVPNTLSAGSIIALCYTNELLGFSAAWQYNDKDVDPGPTWKDVGFTDNSPPWATGTGPFDAKRDAGLPHPNGLDDCRATALHNLGPVGTCINLQSPVTLTNLITSYYRTHFNFSGTPSTSVLVLEGKSDDGMAVYLNGTEVWRIGVGAGATHTTFASRTVGDGDAQDVLILGSPASLINGDNVLAVETHQVNLTSSDMTMGLKVSQLSSTPPVRVSISYSGGNVTVTWAGGTSAGTLRSATSITTPRPWPAVAGNPTSPFTTTASGPQRFFEVSDP